MRKLNTDEKSLVARLQRAQVRSSCVYANIDTGEVFMANEFIPDEFLGRIPIKAILYRTKLLHEREENALRAIEFEKNWKERREAAEENDRLNPPPIQGPIY